MAIVLGRAGKEIDENNSKFIGISLPFRKSDGREGYFESTSITLDSVKENIRLLLNTKRGERVMQPNFGLNLHEYLFENITADTLSIIQNEIKTAVETWLPFITMQTLNITENNPDNSLTNSLFIDIKFFMNRTPGTSESVQVTVE